MQHNHPELETKETEARAAATCLIERNIFARIHHSEFPWTISRIVAHFAWVKGMMQKGNFGPAKWTQSALKKTVFLTNIQNLTEGGR
jgi:hypothetical protein